MTNTPSQTRSRRGPADHEIRDQVMAAATEHFSRYGYEKTTVSDLARAIGFSKAYIYKFFESKQAIGEMICADCLDTLESEIRAAVDAAAHPPDQLRQLFRSTVDAGLRLFFRDHKLYEIAASAATERWPSVRRYEAHVQALVESILLAGRESGDFERKTPLDEATQAVYLVLRPYLSPLLLQHSLDTTDDAPAQLSSLVLRSLSP